MVLFHQMEINFISEEIIKNYKNGLFVETIIIDQMIHALNAHQVAKPAINHKINACHVTMVVI
jgi:hypothetical protein